MHPRKVEYANMTVSYLQMLMEPSGYGFSHAISMYVAT